MRCLPFSTIIILIVACSNLKHLHSYINPLIGTKWKFIGFIHKDSVYRYPIEYNFSLEFISGDRVHSEAFGDYIGEYRIKNDKILVEANISVSYSADLELLKDGSGKALALKRRYQSELLMDRFYYFEIGNDELRIDCNWGIMLFSRSN